MTSHRQRRSAITGRDSEAAWSECHDASLAAGHAYLHKVPVPYVVVRHLGAQQVIQPRARTACDYQGVMLDGTRRRVFAEAKATQEVDGRIVRSKVKDHQAATLDAAVKAGDVALVLLAWGEGLLARFAAVPWDVARSMPSWSFGQCAQWQVKRGQAYLARMVTT